MATRIGLSLVVLIGILTLLYHALVSAYAQILVISSMNYFQLLQQRTKNVDHYYEALQADLKKCVAMQPGNAEIQTKAAHYYLYRNKSGLTSEQQDAIKSYRNAINEMPAKAEWRARFAHTKALAGQFDEEFYSAYERAFRYGNGEYYINEILIQIGLAYWYSTKLDSRLILKDVVINTYLIDANAVLKLAKEYGQLHMVCIWVRGSGQPHRMCEPELTK